MTSFRKICLALCGLALANSLAGLAMGNAALAGAAGAVAAAALPVGIGAIPALRGFQFTAWIVFAVVVPLIYPQAFLSPRLTESLTIDFKNRWAVLVIIQLVMFGMGTRMSLRDFAGVVRMPHGVIVGLVCQFTIMPLVGFTLARLLGFPPEIGAGLVLIGACSSGLASNVMAHMGRLNLPLSITLTACATALAPFVTPFWLSKLGTQVGGESSQFDFVTAMMSVFKIVVAPIGAALVHDYLKRAGSSGRRVVHLVAAVALAWLAALVKIGWPAIQEAVQAPAMLNLVAVAGFLLAAALAGTVYHHLSRSLPGLDRFMPVFSMFGIIYFTAIATATGRSELLTVGLLLCVAAVLHNSIGYVLGYWLSRAMGLKRNDARTVAMEVGMQNGGMAFGIASDLGKLATLGLAAAIFSPWMNVSGSILANYWKRHRPDDDD